MKIPKFRRMNVGTMKRVKANWRKPHGIDSKQRQKLKAYGAYPVIGYRTPRAERGLHPNGLKEALVSNAKQLEALDAKVNCVRFSSTVGKKKRVLLEKLCREKKLKMVN